jgi:predicted extracellular nuclease
LQIFFLLAACSSAVTAPPESVDRTPIYVVQGPGASSPLVGQEVTVSGIVTADFQDGDEDTQNELGGFYIQDAIPDKNPHTSDGIFVFDRPSGSRNLRAGSTVTVVGVVEERNGETQIVASEIEVTGRSNVLPTKLLLPHSATTLNGNGQVIADLEQYEGMLVILTQSLTVSDLYGLARFGEIMLSQDGRLMQFTNSNKPDVAKNALHQQNNILRSIILDDGNLQQNASPARYLKQGSADTAEFSLRVGDEVSGLTGIIRYGRASANSGSQAYRLIPIAEPRFW